MTETLPYNFILRHAAIVDGAVCYDMTLTTAILNAFTLIGGTEAKRESFMKEVNQVVLLFQEEENDDQE